MSQDFILFPDLAAWHLLGVRLGQREKDQLHRVWFTNGNHHMDGLTIWVFVHLRCRIIKDHRAALFTSSSDLYEYFIGFFHRHKVARQGCDFTESPSGFRVQYENKSTLIIPRRSFDRPEDVMGFRLNTLVTAQLPNKSRIYATGRVTRRTDPGCDKHPVFGNKVLHI